MDTLALQRGNTGFTEDIPQLLILTANLSLYNGYRERNQCFVDGGIFALSLVYSLHYYGIGSCMLNWAASQTEDRHIANIIKIRKSERVILVLAIGEIPPKVLVPISKRRNMSELLAIVE